MNSEYGCLILIFEYIVSSFNYTALGQPLIQVAALKFRDFLYPWKMPKIIQSSSFKLYEERPCKFSRFQICGFSCRYFVILHANIKIKSSLSYPPGFVQICQFSHCKNERDKLTQKFSDLIIFVIVLALSIVSFSFYYRWTLVGI